MASKLAYTVAAFFCLVYLIVEVQSSFIKPNNVPRVGRSSESEGPFDQNMMGYVIKTIPSKNIPRMGRRNFNSGNQFDIPKLYQADNFEFFNDEDLLKLNQDQEDIYGNH